MSVVLGVLFVKMTQCAGSFSFLFDPFSAKRQQRDPLKFLQMLITNGAEAAEPLLYRAMPDVDNSSLRTVADTSESAKLLRDRREPLTVVTARP